MDLKLLKNGQLREPDRRGQPVSWWLSSSSPAIRPGTYTVDYVPAVGDYRPDTRPASSLGEQVFDLDSDDDADAWGRPATVWYADNDKANGQYDKDDETVYATIEEEALGRLHHRRQGIRCVRGHRCLSEVVTYTNGEEQGYHRH